MKKYSNSNIERERERERENLAKKSRSFFLELKFE